MRSDLAEAHNFGSVAPVGTPLSSVSLGNDWYHTIKLDTMEATQTAAMTYAMDNVYTPLTDLHMAYDPNYDVRGFDYTYGLNGAVGWVICPPPPVSQGGSHPNHWCYGQELRFNLSYGSYYDTQTERRWVACHELGHTVGLRHHDGSCLNISGPVLTLDADDIAHLNATY